MYRLSADQMGFLHWVIPHYIVLAPTSVISYPAFSESYRYLIL